jgi:hypothetical protein
MVPTKQARRMNAYRRSRNKALRVTTDLDGEQVDEYQQLDESRESLIREKHHATVSYREILAT